VSKICIWSTHLVSCFATPAVRVDATVTTAAETHPVAAAAMLGCNGCVMILASDVVHLNGLNLARSEVIHPAKGLRCSPFQFYSFSSADASVRTAFSLTC
jgi:hypothetical protein